MGNWSRVSNIGALRRCAAAAGKFSRSAVTHTYWGFGIVAAAVGIVNIMAAKRRDTATIGHKVAAALVGAFLGSLISYGLVGPIAAMEHLAHEEGKAFEVVKMVGIFLPIAPMRRAARSRPRPFDGHDRACRRALLFRAVRKGDARNPVNRRISIVVMTRQAEEDAVKTEVPAPAAAH